MKYLTVVASLVGLIAAHGGPPSGLSYEHHGDVFDHDLEPQGVMKDIGNGIQAYITPAEPPKTNTVILYLSDIFGLPIVNNKQLADAIARAGFVVVFPDLFYGDPVPETGLEDPTYNLTAWRERHPPAAIDAIIDSTIKSVTSTYGIEYIGAVGYCFGGKYVARWLAEGKGVDAGFTAHPSSLTEAELQAVVNPLSIAYADNDTLAPPELRQLAEETFIQTGITWQTTLYSHVEHGFAVRANLTDPRQKFAQEGAYLQAVRWLKNWIKP